MEVSTSWKKTFRSVLRICDDRYLNDFLHQASRIFGITFLTEVEELLMQSPHCLLKMSFGCILLIEIIRTTSTNLCLGFFLEMLVLASDVGTCVRIIAPKECTVDIYIYIYIYILFSHIFLSYFQVLRTLVRGFGFEDVKFSSKICSSGSLQAVLAGSHYNRAWFVHELFAKALEWLLLTRFLVEEKPYIPVSVRNGDFQSERLDEKSPESLDAFFTKYTKYRSDVSNGKINKTAQFWTMYLDIMRYQTMAHTAVQENDLKSLMFCWQ